MTACSAADMDMQLLAVNKSLAELRQMAGTSDATVGHRAEVRQMARDMRQWVRDLLVQARKLPTQKAALCRYQAQLDAIIRSVAVGHSPIHLSRRRSGGGSSSGSSCSTEPADPHRAALPSAPVARSRAGAGAGAGCPSSTAPPAPPARLSVASATLSPVDGGEDTPTVLAQLHVYDEDGNRVALQVDDELAQARRRLDRVEDLAADVRHFNEAQRDMAVLMTGSRDRVDLAEAKVELAAERAQRGVLQLADAARYSNKARTKTAASAGAVTGGVVGLVGGPKGAALGAVVGGGFSGWLASKLSGRLNRKLDAIKALRIGRRRGSSPPASTPLADTGPPPVPAAS